MRVSDKQSLLGMPKKPKTKINKKHKTNVKVHSSTEFANY